MVQFKRRRENVEAVQFLPGNAFAREAMQQHLVGLQGWQMDETSLVLPPADEVVRPGDYVIKEPEGSWTVVRQAAFEAEYELEQDPGRSRFS